MNLNIWNNGVTVIYDIPSSRKSQYLKEFLDEKCDRLTSSRDRMRFMNWKQRHLTISTFLSARLRGNAKNWGGSYYRTLLNSLNQTKQVAVIPDHSLADVVLHNWKAGN